MPKVFIGYLLKTHWYIPLVEILSYYIDRETLQEVIYVRLWVAVRRYYMFQSTEQSLEYILYLPWLIADG